VGIVSMANKTHQREHEEAALAATAEGRRAASASPAPDRDV
jgi:hypothetical protein